LQTKDYLITFKRLFTGYATGKAQYSDFQNKVIFLLALIAIPTLVIFSVINFIQGRIWLTGVELLSIILLLPCLIGITKGKRLSFKKNIIMINSLMIFSALFIDGGIGQTGIIWTLILPFIAFLLMGLPVAWYWLIAFAVIITGAITAHSTGIYTLAYSDVMLTYYPAIFIFFSLIAAAFEVQLERLHIRYQEKITELDELQGNLKHNIRDRTAALQKTNDELQREIKGHQETEQALKDSERRFYQAQKMEAVGTLVGGIAHDFNNMLSGIIANLFMVKRKIEDNPELVARIDNISQLTNSAADMIKQLLTFARKDNVEYRSFNLLPFMSEAYKLAKVSISPEIKLTYDFPSEALWVEANATQLQQVLMNLVNNARDALKEQENGTIKVSLQRFVSDSSFHKKHPDLSASCFAKMAVADNGCGIEKEKIGRIFEPFFTTKDTGEGTGLGLAMCYGAIQGHGGTIEVESNPDQGTAFHVYLPIYEDATDDNPEETLRHATRGKGECILLVEDDPILSKIQNEALSSIGYSIMQASDGKEAVERFQQNVDKIDLIILDMVMPVMGGFEAARHIRKMRLDIPIIYVTGYDPEGTIDSRNVPEPGDIVINKPFTIDELSHAVQKQLKAATK